MSQENNKTFKSLTGKVLRVTLPNGGVAVIGNEWIELPEQFHRGAYAEGAISSDMLANIASDVVDAGLANTLTKVATKESDIETTILTWIEDSEFDKFGKVGKNGPLKPKVSELTTALGKRVFKEERDKVWHKLSTEGFEAPSED